MKILFSGGHFSPALSLIEEIGAKHEILVVGRKHAFEGDNSLSYEYLVCKKKDIPFVTLLTGRLQRKFTRYTIPSLFRVPVGFAQVVSIIRKFNPDVVMVFGGYISLPVAFAAYIFGKPIVVHEQTIGASFSNKLISPFAARIFISFESSFRHFPKDRTIHTGNPLRKELFEIKDKISVQDGKKIIYVTGGSAGSHFINSLLGSLLHDILKEYVVIHQTGDSSEYKDFDRLSEIRNHLAAPLKKNYFIRKFIFPDEIGWVFKSADLIISRAGANSIYEYLAFSKVSLLIPLLAGQKNEQLENARFIKKIGVGEYIEQKDCNRDIVFSTIKRMFENKERYLRNLKSGQSYVKLDAGKKILDEIQFLSEQEKKSKKT